MLLHNLEEGVAYSATRAGATRLVSRVWPDIRLPTPGAFQAALLLLTIGAGAIVLWAGMAKRQQAGWLVMRITAAVLLVNVFVPHVPAAIALGGYAPGLVTALTINLPLSLWILLRGGEGRSGVVQA